MTNEVARTTHVDPYVQNSQACVFEPACSMYRSLALAHGLVLLALVETSGFTCHLLAMGAMPPYLVAMVCVTGVGVLAHLVFLSSGSWSVENGSGVLIAYFLQWTSTAASTWGWLEVIDTPDAFESALGKVTVAFAGLHLAVVLFGVVRHCSSGVVAGGAALLAVSAVACGAVIARVAAVQWVGADRACVDMPMLVYEFVSAGILAVAPAYAVLSRGKAPRPVVTLMVAGFAAWGWREVVSESACGAVPGNTVVSNQVSLSQ